MQIIKNVVNWFVWSSKDPSKVSLTVKGALVIALSFIAPLLTIIHFGADLNPVIEQLALITKQVLEVVGSAITLYGLIRKIFLAQ